MSGLWTYTDSTDSVVVSADGRTSMSVNAPPIQAYLAASGVINPAPAESLSDQAAAMLASGVTITSTGTPAISGLYLGDPFTWMKILGIVSFIGVNATFPGGGSTYVFKGKTFPSTASFIALATAYADWVAQLEQIVDMGTGTLPAATVTIA